MTTLTVDPDDLESAAADIREAATGIEATLDDLTAQLRLLATRWTGAASDAFQAAQGSWDTSMDDLRSTLLSIASAVSAAASTYSSTESAVIARCS